MYVGYMYQCGQLHGLQTSSIIKGVLDNWYTTNITDKGYGDYVDGNAGFCGDRRTSSGTGTGTSATDYQPYTRISNSSPSLSCEDADIYTTTDSNTGNKALTQPIGLISVDKVALTGMIWNNANTGSYLYTNSTYWTMSPYRFDGPGYAIVFVVNGSGTFSNVVVTGASPGIRPVINIRSDTVLSGSGTSTDPFKVVGA